MSTLGAILLVLLVLILVGGGIPHTGGNFYGLGTHGGFGLGAVLIVILILVLIGKL